MTEPHTKDDLAAKIEDVIRVWAHEHHADVWGGDQDQLLNCINHAWTKFAIAFPGLRARWQRELEGGE